MQLCLFEDKFIKKFHPLTLSRPVDDLRVGILTIAEKWQHALGVNNHSRILRPEFSDIFERGRIDSAKPCLWINARYLPTRALLQQLKDLDPGTCLRNEATVIAASVSGEESSKWLNNGQPEFGKLLVIEPSNLLSLEGPGDLFRLNGTEIANDLRLLTSFKNSIPPQISGSVFIKNRDEVFIHEQSLIEDNCTLDARNGPIYVAEGATVQAGSHIRGPVAICKNAVVKMGAKIYGETTVGPVCKVGGEISNTIFHSYSNKAHDGFIGNSVIGQWCNLGAGTTVSNLKTNYSTISIADWQTGEMKDSGKQFFGVVMGDHTQTAINTVINSGTLCGVNCNLLTRGFPPKHINSFSWVGSNVIQIYRLEKAFETAEAMMSRRDVVLTEACKKLLTHIFENR